MAKLSAFVRVCLHVCVCLYVGFCLSSSGLRGAPYLSVCSFVAIPCGPPPPTTKSVFIFSSRAADQNAVVQTETNDITALHLRGNVETALHWLVPLRCQVVSVSLADILHELLRQHLFSPTALREYGQMSGDCGENIIYTANGITYKERMQRKTH